MNIPPEWLFWARELQALAQSGLVFAAHPADKQRYERIEEISAQILAYSTPNKVEAVLENIRMDRGYATPKIGVRGLVFRGDKLLLVQEKYNSLWNIPGGWIEVGDQIKESVEREIWEEAGLCVKAKQLVAIWDCDKNNPQPYHFHGYHLYFLCEDQKADIQPQPSDETSGGGFFSLPETIHLNLNPRLKSKISTLYTWKSQPPQNIEIE